MTRWAKDVTPEHVLPDYPRPQLVRRAWQNLNGLWDYAIRPAADPALTTFDGAILVPFPVESALSGVAKPVASDAALWYRRTFTVPTDWKGQRLLLNFGAVDWQTTAWLNGKPVGEHAGGYDPFTFDLTDALSGAGEQTLLVRVTDPSNSGTQPRGKQVREPRGIFYTSTTGIWQTVWLEPAPAAHITRVFAVDTDLAGGEIALKWDVSSREPVTQTNVEIFAEGKSVGTAKTSENGYTVHFDHPRQWSPDDPFLYNIRITLQSGDSVESYFAFRTLSAEKDDAGVNRLLLNGRFVFQYGVLDQGFWPDGLYTAPTDEAMRNDLEVIKKLGFNMVRKHVKVETARWYHYCDQMGLLVWQDMPSGDKNVKRNGADLRREPASAAVYEREWSAIIESLKCFPSIVTWVPFNEGWGQYDTARIAKLTHDLDPTRWIDNASGWVDRGVGDMLDLHVYPGPEPAEAVESRLEGRALVLGEFGGLGLPIRGHTWQDDQNWGYRTYTSPAALTDAYAELLARLHPLVGKPGYCAAVYTQTTDVEIEVNGLMTYDRQVLKIEPKRAADAARQLFSPPPVERTLLPDARHGAADWRYTTAAPADGWQAPSFDDSKWARGPAGFGNPTTPGTQVRTPWSSDDIWIRRTFELPADASLDLVRLSIHHDEDAEVYLNGVLAADPKGFTTAYALLPITPQSRTALKAGSANTIAVHCHQRTGGQYIDVGLVSYDKPKP